MTDKIKVFRDHKELYPDFQSIILGCIPALFAHQIDIEVLRNIWDIFFIYGYVIILRAFYFFASVLLDRKYKNNIFENDDVPFSDLAKNIKCNDLLNYFLLMDETINNSYLNEEMKRAKKIVDDEDKKHPRKKEIGKNPKCDPTTPFCFYNQIINNVEAFSEYKIFKLKENTEKNENYFSDLFSNDKFNDNNGKVIKNETKGDTFDDILVERVSHVCTKENQVENK